MKCILVILLLITSLSPCFGQDRQKTSTLPDYDTGTRINGDYVSLEAMESLSPEDAGTKWFH